MKETGEQYSSVVSIEESGDKFRLVLSGEPVRTPGGHTIEHSNEALIARMMDELRADPAASFSKGVIEQSGSLNTYQLYSSQLDFPELPLEGADLVDVITRDPLMHVEEPWHECGRAIGWQPIKDYISSLGVDDRGLSVPDSKYIKEIAGRLSGELYELTAPEKAVFKYLFRLHENSILGPIAFIRARLPATQFATAMAGCHQLMALFAPEVERSKQFSLAKYRITRNASVCREYLALFEKKKPPTVEQLWQEAEQLLDEGEITLDHYPSACPEIVPDFIANFAERSEPKTVLDPWLELGALAAPLLEKLDIERFIGVCSCEEILELSEQLFSSSQDIKFKLGYGDQGEYDTELFDLVISYLPINGPRRDFEWKGKHLKLPLEVEIAVRSAARLADTGIAAYIVPPEYLYAQHWARGRALLQEEGIAELAVFHLPSALLRPFSTISMYIVILGRDASEAGLFVGEVTEDKSVNAQLLENLRKGKSARLPERGQFLESKDFIGLPQLISRTKLENQTKRTKIPRFRLGQIASIKPVTTEPQGSNSLYIRLVGVPTCTIDFSDIQKSHHHNWAAVHCDTEKADARVVMEFLNGPLGQLGLAALSYKGMSQGITVEALSEVPIWLATLPEQQKTIELSQRLQELESSARSLRHDLWARLDHLAEAQEKADNLNKQDSLPVWIDTLPFPLASILWTYHTHKGDAQRRYSQLDYFFEGLTQFLAAVLISGVKTDQTSFGKAWPEVLKALSKGKLSLERATIGTWVTVFSSLAKVVRAELNDVDAAAHWQRQFACEQKPLLEALTSKKMSKILQDANEFRNGWRGHGGIVGDDEAARRASVYFDLLLKFRSLVENRWRNYPLVIPESSKFKGGLNHYTVKRIVGSRTPFEKEKLVLKQQMEDGVMHLVSSTDGTACTLVPFIRLGASPVDAKNACYFFSKREGAKVKYVSYHFAEKPELHTEAAETQRFLEELLS